MKLKLVIAVAALQVLVLGFMAGQREWIMHTGMPLTLRTAPIDPNDPMRGAYVRLTYDISVVPAALCRGEVADWMKLNSGEWRQRRSLRDRVVYAALKINEHGIAELTALREIPPTSGPFLRGRVVSVDNDDIRVRYGIEALFMSKKAALRTESMAIKEKAGAPMAVSVAVGGNGTAVLKDFAWEPLGLTIMLQRPAQPETRDPNRPRRPQPINAVTVTLHNYGDQDLAIVDLPGGRSLRLVPNMLVNSNRFVWAPPVDFATPAPAAENIIVLKPGESRAIQIDLTHRNWWIKDTTKPEKMPSSMTQLEDWNWAASFRLEYTPPSADAVRGLPHANLIRHAPLRSRAFSAMQGVD